MKTTDTSLSKRERSALVTAAESVQQKNAACRRASNFDFLIYVLIVLLCAFSLRQFVVEPAHVAGDSMHPTLLDTEYLLVEKVSYWFNPPQRYDIVVCNYPGYTESCVKRVIALPGETVQVKNGRILINGQRLDEEAYWHIEDEIRYIIEKNCCLYDKETGRLMRIQHQPNSEYKEMQHNIQDLFSSIPTDKQQMVLDIIKIAVLNSAQTETPPEE